MATTHFSPDQEIGTGYNRFSDESCYKKHFENCPHLGEILKDVNKIFSDKFGSDETHQKVQASSVRVLGLFQNKMKGTLKRIEEEEDLEEKCEMEI